ATQSLGRLATRAGLGSLWLTLSRAAHVARVRVTERVTEIVAAHGFVVADVPAQVLADLGDQRIRFGWSDIRDASERQLRQLGIGAMVVAAQRGLEPIEGAMQLAERLTPRAAARFLALSLSLFPAPRATSRTRLCRVRPHELRQTVAQLVVAGRLLEER